MENIMVDENYLFFKISKNHHTMVLEIQHVIAINYSVLRKCGFMNFILLLWLNCIKNHFQGIN